MAWALTHVIPYIPVWLEPWPASGMLAPYIMVRGTVAACDHLKQMPAPRALAGSRTRMVLASFGGLK